MLQHGVGALPQRVEEQDRPLQDVALIRQDVEGRYCQLAVCDFGRSRPPATLDGRGSVASLLSVVDGLVRRHAPPSLPGGQRLIREPRTALRPRHAEYCYPCDCHWPFPLIGCGQRKEVEASRRTRGHDRPPMIPLRLPAGQAIRRDGWRRRCSFQRLEGQACNAEETEDICALERRRGFRASRPS